MRIKAIFVGTILCSTLLIGDEHKVDFDSQVDFSKIKTFKISGGKIAIEKPEINNSLVLTKIKDIIRTALTSKGLKETGDRPDVVADFVVSGQDYSTNTHGVTRPIQPNRGRRGAGDSQGTAPADFTEGMLVLDLTAGQPGVLIWRGVYRDNEKNTSKLAQKLPDDAKKILSEYPPKKKN